MQGTGGKGGSETLVVYGIPPTPLLVDFTGRSLGKRFELTRSNQVSFEKALRRALAAFLKDHLNLATARMVFVKNAAELTAVIKSSKPRRLVYYGHAVLGSKALLPSIGQAVEVWSLVEMLKHSSVTDFDILGCNGTSIAADLSIQLPGVRVGYLRAAREDNLVVDLHTLQVKELHFDDQTLRHFPTR